MSPSHRVSSLVLALSAGAVACSSGNAGTSMTVPVRGDGTAELSITIDLPPPVAPALRKPHYISPSLASVVVEILQGSTPVNVGADYVNISASNAACTTVSGATSCVLHMGAAIGAAGTYTVAIGTYDTPQTQTCIPHGVPACAG